MSNSAESGSADVHEFLTPARLNYGVNAGFRPPQLLTLYLNERMIPLPVPGLANVEIPFDFPIFSIPSRRQVAKGHEKNKMKIE